MSRLKVIVPDTIDAREFVYYCDMIQKDMQEEEDQRKRQQQKFSGYRRY